MKSDDVCVIWQNLLKSMEDTMALELNREYPQENEEQIFAEMVDGCLRRVTRWTPDRNGMLT